MTDLAARLDRIEAESAIRQLIARYGFAIDDHDLEAVLVLFADDAMLGTADGALGASGIASLRDYFRIRFASTGVANHVTHDVVIEFTGPDAATGRVSAHSELWRESEMIVTAFRYTDKYHRTERGWRFASRIVSYLYYVPADRYAGILGQSARVHTQSPAKPGDYPERLAAWRTQ
jgi:uncharacterized protein (TIGR02246 family)